MKRLLLTGASGFLGRACCLQAIAKGFEVVSVSYQRDGIIHEQVEHIRGNLLNRDFVREVVRGASPSHLLHLAWCTEHGKFWTDPANIKWLQTSLLLLQCFADQGGQRAVFVGSCAEYDWRYGICSEEHTPQRPWSLYGSCKQALSIAVESFSKHVHLSTAWARLFYLFGPYEPQTRLVPSAITAFINRKPFLCSDGTQILDFLYVDEAAAGILALLESSVQGPVNVASGTPIRVSELISMIASRLEGENLIQWGSLARPDQDPVILVADISRLTKEVCWIPSHDILTAVEKTITWWKQQCGVKNDE